MRKVVFTLAVVALAACGPAARNNGHGTDSANGNGDGGCGPSCSADLRNILDCGGNVVETCPDDQGCANGACVDACQAAATGKSSIGCDYYAVEPDTIIPGQCFAAYIANTWTSPVTITVERAGTQLPIDGFARIPSGQGQALTYAALTNGMLQPNQVAILFLARNSGIACPAGVTPAVTLTDGAVHGTALGDAFHITTSEPTVAYDIYPYGGGSSALTSATLLLPTSAWDVNYVAVDAFTKSVITSGQPFTELVALADNTHVTIRPTAAIVAGTGVVGATQGTSTIYALDAGQYVQFTQDDELIGSPITSDQPVGVWGGASCLSIDVSIAACDGAHQEIPPVKAMGNHYAAVRYRNRFMGVEETVPWRIVGGVDGTMLTYEPAPPTGAPPTINAGELVTFDAPGPFTVTSQDAAHPFYMSAHMSGCETYGEQGDCRGDPEFVDIVPPEQYLPAYTFFTDPTYPETNLVLTRMQINGSFADVTVDCAGVVTGWTPIDAADTIEYTRLDLVTGNFASVGGCNNGLHVASSAQPFGLTVWGWGSAASTGFSSQAVSYAYPAGASVRPINNVVIE